MVFKFATKIQKKSEAGENLGLKYGSDVANNLEFVSFSQLFLGYS